MSVRTFVSTVFKDDLELLLTWNVSAVSISFYFSGFRRKKFTMNAFRIKLEYFMQNVPTFHKKNLYFVFLHYWWSTWVWFQLMLKLHISLIVQCCKNFTSQNKYSENVLHSSYDHLTIILWSSYNHLTIILQSSYNHLTIILQSSYNHLTITLQSIILQSSYNHLTIILLSPYDHLTIIIQSSYDHLTIILLSPYNHLMITLLSSYDHLTIILWSSYYLILCSFYLPNWINNSAKILM
jgi:hypothetical protein